MQHRARYLKAGVVACFLLATIPAFGDEVYVYNGQTFNDLGYSCGVGTFNGLSCNQLRSDNITSSIDLLAALGANYNGVVSGADIASWSMSSAGLTVSNTNGGQDFYFDVATDGSGAITDWAVFADAGLGGAALLTSANNGNLPSLPYGLSASDDSLYNMSCAAAGYGCQSNVIFGNQPLTSAWSSTYVPETAPTPEPVWDALIALCVFLPAGWYQRRRLKRKAQFTDLPYERATPAEQQARRRLRNPFCETRLVNSPAELARELRRVAVEAASDPA